jgi:hypothetical protein
MPPGLKFGLDGSALAELRPKQGHGTLRFGSLVFIKTQCITTIHTTPRCESASTTPPNVMISRKKQTAYFYEIKVE